ncbi:hypothetical protein G3M48_008099 [Beauveria asiatica]|uniref:Uncharacterized protein n=1 Tax=Beauveria asiatica TaxID=1069075 RepID=A0AAW0RKW1_9HYPO
MAAHPWKPSMPPSAPHRRRPISPCPTAAPPPRANTTTDPTTWMSVRVWCTTFYPHRILVTRRITRDMPRPAPRVAATRPRPSYATADEGKCRRRYEAREDPHLSRKTHELREHMEKANAQISDRNESAVKMQQPKLAMKLEKRSA